MTEPVSGSQVLKWGGTTIGAGLTYAVAAVETNPEMATALTPDLHTSLYMLVFGAVAAALKIYVPSEKSVTARFDVLEAQHRSMSEAIREAAHESKEATAETRTFRLELAGWMGAVDEKLSGMKERINDFEERKQ